MIPAAVKAAEVSSKGTSIYAYERTVRCLRLTPFHKGGVSRWQAERATSRCPRTRSMSCFPLRRNGTKRSCLKSGIFPLEEIDDFPDHPFKVREDEDMFQLVESIKERGVITPATVRQKEDGRYELISGHRRKRACELAGFETLRCEVVDLDRDEATILMVESNFQRSQILPSEKAHAYKCGLTL